MTDSNESRIQRATSVFMSLGLRAVNMSGPWTTLSWALSKKTLYKYFSDKRDLGVESAWLGIVGRPGARNGEAKSTSENAIEAELKLMEFKHQMLVDMQLQYVVRFEEVLPQGV